MFNLSHILRLCLMFVVVASSVDFPSDVERCKYSDSVCLSRVVTDILRKYSKGHPGLNIIKFEPLHVERMMLNKIPESRVSVEFNFTNVDLIGISRGTVLNLTGFTKEPMDLVLDMKVNYPELVMTADYSCDGQILDLPIYGSGKSKITFDDTLFFAKVNCTTRLRDGKVYLEIVDGDMDIQAKKVSFSFTNLYKGDKVMGDNMNKLLNDNWRVVFEELRPLLADAFGQQGVIVASGTFSTIPYLDMFLKS